MAVTRQGVQPFALLAPASQVFGVSCFAQGGRCASGCSTLRAPVYGVSGSFGFPPLRESEVACQGNLPFALMAPASLLLFLLRAGVDFRADLECDAGRHVGLDQAGDDIDRGSLGCKNEVNACGTCFLCNTGDQLLYFLANDHHHIGEFVDNDNNCR